MAIAKPAPKSRAPKTSASNLSNAKIAGAAVVGVTVVGGLATLAINAILKARGSGNHSGAFAHGETDSHNFDQTRSAGPDSMRDGSSHDWDKIDQALDESFPASDPIGVSHVD